MSANEIEAKSRSETLAAAREIVSSCGTAGTETGGRLYAHDAVGSSPIPKI